MSKAAKKPQAAPPARGWSAVRPFIIALATLLIAVFALLGLRELGERAGLHIGSRDRYVVRLADVEFPVPPGLNRQTFLDEVRRASDAAETYQRLEPTMPLQLAAAFEAHPWVEKADRVTIDPDGTVRVSLRFRTPVLVVQCSSGVCLVDANAVVLPRIEIPSGLAILTTPLTGLMPEDGRRWPDPLVKRAVELVGAYHPSRLEITKAGWKLAMPDGKELLVEK